jgi:hypothetical protein
MLLSLNSGAYLLQVRGQNIADLGERVIARIFCYKSLHHIQSVLILRRCNLRIVLPLVDRGHDRICDRRAQTAQDDAASFVASAILLTVNRQ